MSPRSREFMSEAHERLRACPVLLAEDISNAAVSDAYYAVLYAARAALSEEDVNAKVVWLGSSRTYRGQAATGWAAGMSALARSLLRSWRVNFH